MPPNNPSDNTNPTTPPSSNKSQPYLPEAMLDADEHVVTVVRRHPIGIIYLYLVALAFIAALTTLIILAFPDLFSNLSTESNMLVVAAAVFGTSLIFLMLFIATYVYRQSKLIVTDKNLIQVMQKTLFLRKVSRLSISNVEDVSAEQRGILPTIFNYGVLTVQTAGEMENFIFPFCPDPNKYANRIHDARQEYADRLKEE